MSAKLRILHGIILTSLYLLTVQAATSAFQRKAIDTIEQVHDHLHIEDCINSAKEKANSIGETYGNRHYAALWINMYSRDCLINQDFLTQEKDLNKFPFRLNKELRCLRNKERDQALSDTFVKVRNIIDDSLSDFGMTYYPTVYRGMTTWNYEGQKYFVDEGYFSTSLDATPAIRFAKGKILLIVQEVNGVHIERFVQDRFKYQKEVIGKSGKMFEIVRKVTNRNELMEIVDTLNVNWTKLSGKGYPETVIYIKEVSGLNKQSVINKQWQNMESYCSVEGSTNVGFVLHCTTIFIAIMLLCVFPIYFLEKKQVSRNTYHWYSKNINS